MARIGLLGGSFNPAHRGHRHISLQALKALGLDQVWWLVSAGNPLEEGGKGIAAFEGLFASAGPNAPRGRVRVSEFAQRQGLRFTVGVLRELESRRPPPP